MFKISLNKLLESTYGIDLDRVNDYDNFYFDGVEINDSDVYNNEIRSKYNYLDEEDFLMVARRAAFDRYVYSYTNEYFSAVIEAIDDKIRHDLNKLGDLFSENDEFTGDGYIGVYDIDWDKYEVILEGNIDTFACYLINIINGYGMFVFDSLDEFWYTNSAENDSEKIDAVEGHLHWLQYTEDIYGTGENYFRLDVSKIGEYSCYGDFDYTEEDFKYAMDCVL